MPTQTTRIAKVTHFDVKNATKFWIYAEGSPEPWETLSAWKASIAQRAVDLNQPVTVGLKDTKYGREIVTIVLEAT